MSEIIEVPLVEISRPKQWPTLSRRELTKTGYPVYGANGQIGFTDSYTHADPTVIIGCRGSCGQIHVTVPNAYVTGNAMALDALDLDRVDQSYLVHFLRKRGFDDIISGSSQPQITRKSLSRLFVPLPSVQEQRRISALLEKADAINKKYEQALGLADEFLKSVFLEMFGDPVCNSKGLCTKPLSWFGEIVTGNTPPRSNPQNFGCHMEWIKSDNINTPHHYITEAKEYLSKEGAVLGRTVPKGAVLVICIAGSPASIGRAAIADRDIAFNQQINAIVPKTDVDQHFLYAQFVVGQRLVQAASTNSMKGMVSKGKFKEIQFLAPAPDEQQKFGEIFRKYLENSTRLLSANNASQDLFSSLLQRAFSGEL